MAFATASDLAAYLQRSGLTAAQTATAELLLDLATAALQAAVGQRVELVTDDVLLLDAPTGAVLTIPERPALAPSLVRVEGVAVTDFTASVPTSPLRPTTLYRSSGWQAYDDTTGAPLPVEVTVTHGYSTIPSELKRLCLQAAGRAFRNPEGLRSETIGAESYVYAVPASGDVPDVGLTRSEVRQARRALGLGGAFTVDVVPAYVPAWPF